MSDAEDLIARLSGGLAAADAVFASLDNALCSIPQFVVSQDFCGFLDRNGVAKIGIPQNHLTRGIEG